MKKIYLIVLLLIPLLSQSQENKTFKKKVLESAELDILTSYYSQEGENAAVTGGIGNESLQDAATNINISIPVNSNDVLSIDATVSAYTSASSSNLNPFSGASQGEDDDDDDDRPANTKRAISPVTGSPWVASSGASKSDVWVSGSFGYSHTSNNRNTILNTHLSISNEFDYFSFGFGAGIVKLFNQKNTEVSLGGTIYKDTWRPEYPTEIKTYIKENGNLYADFFNGVPIWDQNGIAINKSAPTAWKPQNNYLIDDKGRDTYALSIGFSQILSPRLQIALFSDITYQKGWLANPMQRVYFADKANFYIGNPADIPVYTDPNANTEVFQLADDIERLPDSRLKIPVGMRLNFYINEFLVVRTYYRYYFDDWGINSNTFNIELPIKLSSHFTIYPSYRYYNQTAADYFAPYEQHLSTQTYYTSDFDLSEFNANQYGFGIKYYDALTKTKIWKIGLKNISLNYNYYSRTTGLNAHIISLGTKLILD